MSKKIYNLLIRDYFTINKRAGRIEYVSRFMFMIFMCLVFTILDDYKVNTFITGFFIGPIVGLSIIQTFLVTHRRLHDLNCSGLWQLISFMPFGQLLILWLMFKKGTDGVNDYGEPPEY